MAEAELPKPKRRPIVRLGILLISHSSLFSVLCCTAGFIALLLLPVLAKNTYISENALMPGSASSMISNQDVAEANRLAKELAASRLQPREAGIERRGVIAKYISNLGAEVSYHEFHPQLNQFRPLSFFAGPDTETRQENLNCSLYGVSTVGIIRAPQGDGKEAIVLVTPYNFEETTLGETLSLSIAYSVFSLLNRVTWLAKDIIWLVADSQFGDYTSVDAWLREYHTPAFSPGLCGGRNSSFPIMENADARKQISGDFRRAGTMAAALVLKVADTNDQMEDTLGIYAEASNGQMPNLDLINIVSFLAVHRQGLRVNIEKCWSLLKSKWIEIIGEMFELVGKLARSLNPQWKIGIPASDFVEGTATLASSMYRQALGIPTGPHGAFRDFQVDAITLEVLPRSFYSSKARENELVLRGGRLIEGVVRSINNLLEKFHQSFFLYLLTSSGKFVSVGVYMIAFALVVAPLPLIAASLYVNASKLEVDVINGKPSSSTMTSDKVGFTIRSWKWLDAAKEVLVVHAWGAITLLLPYLICRIPNCSPTNSFAIWVLLSLLNLLLVYSVLGSPSSDAHASQPPKGEWLVLKAVTISAAFIGLLLMSIVNFATAEIGALLIVPFCLMARPLKIESEDATLRSFFRIFLNAVLGFVAFPPATFFLLKGAFGSSDSTFGDYWNWMESLWAWSSATYIYIGMVHLPCWALCIRILLNSR